MAFTTSSELKIWKRQSWWMWSTWATRIKTSKFRPPQKRMEHQSKTMSIFLMTWWKSRSKSQKVCAVSSEQIAIICLVYVYLIWSRPTTSTRKASRSLVFNCQQRTLSKWVDCLVQYFQQVRAMCLLFCSGPLKREGRGGGESVQRCKFLEPQGSKIYFDFGWNQRNLVQCIARITIKMSWLGNIFTLRHYSPLS